MTDRIPAKGMLLIPPADKAPLEAIERLTATLHKLDEMEQRPAAPGGRNFFRRTRLGRLLAGTWRAWCVLCGVAAASLPPSYALVSTFSGHGEVVRALSGPMPIKVVLHEGGQLSFIQTVERLEACPGEAIDTFTPVDGGSIVVQRRPVVRQQMGVLKDLVINTQLPGSMPDGRWHYSLSVDSHCPLRERVDTLATFDIEVTP